MIALTRVGISIFVVTLLVSCASIVNGCPSQIEYKPECDVWSLAGAKDNLNETPCNKYGQIAWNSGNKVAVETKILSVKASCVILEHATGTQKYQVFGSKEAQMNYTVYLSSKINDKNWFLKNALRPSIRVEFKSSNDVVYAGDDRTFSIDAVRSDFSISGVIEGLKPEISQKIDSINVYWLYR